MSDRQSESELGHQVRIFINQSPHHSPSSTTGAALYALGAVPTEQDIYRDDGDGGDDEPLPNSDQELRVKVDEHFRTGPRRVTIIVNGRRKEVRARPLSFADLVALAFDPVPIGPNIMFTISFRNGPRQNPEGTLLEGKKVKIREGMIFDVTPTDRS